MYADPVYTIDMLIYTCYRMHNKLLLLNIHSQSVANSPPCVQPVKNARAENALATQLNGARKRVRPPSVCVCGLVLWFFYDCIYAKCQRVSIITLILFAISYYIANDWGLSWPTRRNDRAQRKQKCGRQWRWLMADVQWSIKGTYSI